MNIVVTGASGFIGRPLCCKLQSLGHTVFPVVRSNHSLIKEISHDRHYFITDCDQYTDWSPILRHAEVLINLLAKAHQTSRINNHDVNDLDVVNVKALERLAKQACCEQIKHIIHLSSIKVNGEKTEGIPFRITDRPHPSSAYGFSKYEAEKRLKAICQNSHTTLTIIRPPLVYGCNQKGNLKQLQTLLSFGLPLPFSSSKNKRHLISIYNLIDLIVLCIKNRNLSNQTFLAADAQSINTADLIKLIGKTIDKKVFLFDFPQSYIEYLLRLIKKESLIEKLFFDLEVDISYTREVLNWQPSLSVEEGFELLLKENST